MFSRPDFALWELLVSIVVGIMLGVLVLLSVGGLRLGAEETPPALQVGAAQTSTTLLAVVTPRVLVPPVGVPAPAGAPAEPRARATLAPSSTRTPATQDQPASTRSMPTATGTPASASPTSPPARAARLAATPPTPTRVPARTSTPTRQVITSTVIARGANVRSSPAIGDNVIGLVHEGDELILLGVLGDWYLVRLGAQTAVGTTIRGGQGWVGGAVVKAPRQVPPRVALPLGR
jgi:hypothetical protein